MAPTQKDFQWLYDNMRVVRDVAGDPEDQDRFYRTWASVKLTPHQEVRLVIRLASVYDLQYSAARHLRDLHMARIGYK